MTSAYAMTRKQAANAVVAKTIAELEQRNAALVAALELFAWIDETTPSELWAIDKAACVQARAALAAAKGGA